MATTPQARNFFTFVTAHGPFELTAIVFSGAAGLRLGSGLIVTQGQSRLASLRREAARSLPIAGVAVILFVLAAFLEGFVSASPLPYWSKAAIALASAVVLAFYLFALGRGRGSDEPASLAESAVRSSDLDPAEGRRALAIERTLVQIRERSLVDLLDLALVVVRRRPGTLGLAALAGIAPFAALNAWLFAAIPDLAPVVPLTLWMLEAPFATAPLTVVLGGLMFGQRPTAGQGRSPRS